MPLPPLDDSPRKPTTSPAHASVLPSGQATAALPLHPPPSYSPSHDPAAFSALTELAPIQPRAAQGDPGGKTLPSLLSVTGPESQRLASLQDVAPGRQQSPPVGINNWPSLNPLTAYYNAGYAQADDPPLRMDVDGSSSSALSAASPERNLDGRAPSVSLDDPDVRMAAEALGDLRAGA